MVRGSNLSVCNLSGCESAHRHEHVTMQVNMTANMTIGNQDAIVIRSTHLLQAERDTVNSSEAEACFGDGNYVAAARLLGKVTAAVPAFEETVLRFVEVNSPPALQAFLQTKMDSLGQEDKAQVGLRIWLGSWLAEQSHVSLHAACRVRLTVCVVYHLVDCLLEIIVPQHSLLVRCLSC